MELNEGLDTVLSDIQLACANLIQADAALRLTTQHDRESLITDAHSALENAQSIIAEAIEIVEEL